MSVQDSIKKTYPKVVRSRVMGLLRSGDRLLMVKHSGLNKADELWLPPGGGVDFGETMTSALKKEFYEECGLNISIKDFLFSYEFISNDFHAIEHFFEVIQTGGELKKGYDPELGTNQIIEAVGFVSFEELKNMPNGYVHEIFDAVDSLDQLFEKRGIFKL